MTEELEKLLDHSLFSSENISKKVDELTQKLNQLQTESKYNDPEYASSSKELADLQELQSKINLAKDLITREKELENLRNEAGMQDLIAEEEAQIQEQVPGLVKLFNEYLVEPLEDDDKKAIFEIRPGVGGVEASLFAEELFRSYLRYCNENKYPVTQVSLVYDDQGGIKEAIFFIDSNNSYGKFRFESGVHRVQRVPKTEAAGRIHTSTASVVVMPKYEMRNVEIKDADIRIDVYRSSGPGGQSVNTTDSAVRITHLPTGIVVSCQNGKSQHQNKEFAFAVLASKLKQLEISKKSEQEKNLRDIAISGGDRSAKIRTYNFPQSRVTDHRINQSWFNINEIMNGELDEVISEVSTNLRQEAQSK